MDQRGDGRPDYNYRAHILYADSVSPSTVPAKGAAITISGMGFRNGDIVMVNGVPAPITGLTANAITAVTPSLHLSGATAADVTVRDLATNATTTMTAALSYQAPQPELDLLSAPYGLVVAQVTASTPLILKAVAADGTSPMPGVPVVLSSGSGQLRFEACGSTACSLVTGPAGTISTAVTPLSSGPITFTGASSIGSVTSNFTAIPHIQTVTTASPRIFLSEKAVLTWNPQVSLTDNGTPTAGVSVQWTALSGPVSFHPTQSLANDQAIAQTTATAGPFLSDTQATASACAWTAICSGFYGQVRHGRTASACCRQRISSIHSSLRNLTLPSCFASPIRMAIPSQEPGSPFIRPSDHLFPDVLPGAAAQSLPSIRLPPAP